ncbi:MAG: hypothetical protein KGL39_43335 [Patescibacteria group bacterium]|nr:hypothetical protein [Patescibacteria group bacterium]
MNAQRVPDRGVYERAEAIVDDLVCGDVTREVVARLARVVGAERAQIAVCRAIVQVAGNLLAKLAGNDEAERFHRERAMHYALSAARAPARWRAKR